VTVGLFFVAALALMLGLFGTFPRPSEEDRDAERRSWRSREPMAAADRAFLQRSFILRVAARPLLVIGMVSLVAAIVSAIAG
jgi:hypothetical protein